ncbi:MAG: hypothetical protein JXB47_07365 [Anaerolineae bacterium]|nr:hypothetical protein [Anaerolineae bacterium]
MKRLMLLALITVSLFAVVPAFAQEDITEIGECNLGNDVNEGISGRGILYHTSDGDNDFLKDYFGITDASLNVRDGIVTIGYAGAFDAEEAWGPDWSGTAGLWEVGYYNPNIAEASDRYKQLGWFFFASITSGPDFDYIMKFATADPAVVTDDELYNMVYGYWGMKKCEWDGAKFLILNQVAAEEEAK